jgi:hypothetical protein
MSAAGFRSTGGLGCGRCRSRIVERHAESAEVLDEDEESVKLLPPVQRRAGLVLLIAGPDAFVTEPADLRDAGRDLARELLAHHAHEG